MGLNGNVLDGKRRPSSERQMHLLYYGSRHEVRAMCHAHPPTATGFAAAGRALEEAGFSGSIVRLGNIPLAPEPPVRGSSAQGSSRWFTPTLRSCWKITARE